MTSVSHDSSYTGQENKEQGTYSTLGPTSTGMNDGLQAGKPPR